MERRREFLKKSFGFAASLGILFSPFFSVIKTVYARTKRIILPKGTKSDSLSRKNPRDLDTRNLEITHLKDFDTMGVSDHEVDLGRWRLLVEGEVKTPLKLTYDEVKALPAIQRKVLLICPGFFSQHGDWKGPSMERLLESAGMRAGATHVTFVGPDSDYQKTERFPLNELLSGKVFLAYDVNGKTLPRKHGFPLRIVAEDYYGGTWVKYVYKMIVEKIA